MLDHANALLRELRKRVAEPVAGDQYVDPIRETALLIHEALCLACASRTQEIEAHKSNDRILRFCAVGPVRGTRISYCRAPLADYGSRPEWFDEEMELVQIEEFRMGSDWS